MHRVHQKGEDIRVLDNGVVIVDRGPMLMSISVSNKGIPEIELAREGGKRALESLSVLANYRHVITQEIDKITSVDSLPLLIKKMVLAVRKFDDPTATPLIAVAGTGADEVADFVHHAGKADKVVVNNGGDIAIRLRGEETVKVGIKSDITEKAISHVLTVTTNSEIGGVATSGFGGRSFTRGVANAAVAVANDAISADVAATLIGNATEIDSPNVARTKAQDLYECTDIPDLLVTKNVGHLAGSHIRHALDCGMRKAGTFQDKKLIIGAVLAVKDHIEVSESIAPFVLPVSDLVAV
jgi:ApbE superfamily uncharacterized protein (UPF0280 family)